NIYGLSLFLCLALGLTACGGGPTVVESDLGLDDAPDWVNEGSQALDAQEGRYIHGVGMAPTMPDRSLQVATADNRARAEVARVLSSYMHVVSQDYTAAVGQGQQAYSEQAVSRQIDNITRLNMSGVRIIAHWRNEDTGAIYALAELDMQRVRDVVGKVEMMNADFKSYFETHADAIFKDFSED
ncbi:MAG TPA: hypothetical protein VFP95_05190, partial [Gammaproteobacteria bacterium]|nr:hypothetical protein [Gammaproteobacteria bacterium]